MNSTPNTKHDLVARADEQIARTYEQIARADEQLAHVSERFPRIERDAVHDPSVGSAAEVGSAPEPPPGRFARPRLIGLLSAACVVGIVVAFVLQSSHGGVTRIGAQWAPQLVSTPSIPLKPSPAQPDPLPVQAIAEAAPPQAAPSSRTGPQDNPAPAPAASELTLLLQKMTGDIANLEQALKQLQARQDQIASDNAKAIEQLKTKQEDMARVLAKVSEQSASTRTPQPSAGPTQSPQAATRPQVQPPRRQYPPRLQYPPRWQYYDDEW